MIVLKQLHPLAVSRTGRLPLSLAAFLDQQAAFRCRVEDTISQKSKDVRVNPTKRQQEVHWLDSGCNCADCTCEVVRLRGISTKRCRVPETIVQLSGVDMGGNSTKRCRAPESVVQLSGVDISCDIIKYLNDVETD